jgi:hypothetical protein
MMKLKAKKTIRTAKAATLTKVSAEASKLNQRKLIYISAATIKAVRRMHVK